MNRNQIQDALAPIDRAAVHGPEASEEQHQMALVQWARETAELQSDELKRDALLFFHAIPNNSGKANFRPGRAGKKGLPPVAAVKLKKMGRVAGISDLRLDYVQPRLRYVTTNGLFSPIVSGAIINFEQKLGLVAEMKSAIGKLSTEQKAYHAFMVKQGFACQTWRTWQLGAVVIVSYMELETFAPIYLLRADSLKSVTTTSALKSLDLSKFLI